MPSTRQSVSRFPSARSNPRLAALGRAKTALPALVTLSVSLAFSAPALAVDRYVDASTGSNGPNNCTVAKLPCKTIAYAASQSFNGDVLWLKGTFNEYGVLLATTITLKGNGPAASIDAAGLGRHFRVASSGEVRLENLTLLGGVRADDGGAVRVNSGSLVVDRVTFDGNTAPSGGAIACVEDCTSLTVLDSVFQFNSATGVNVNDGYGGAIKSEADTTIRRSLMTANESVALGGAVFVDGLYSEPHLLLTDTEMDSNMSGSGGAVYARYAAANVRRCSFIDNEATGHPGATAGAFGGSGERVEIVNTSFTGNSANYAGAVNAFDLFLGNVTFVDNAATVGRSDFTGDTVEMHNSIVSHPAQGGGIQPSCAAWGTLLGENNLLEKACDPSGVAGAPALFWLDVLSAGSLGNFDYHGGKTRVYELLAGSNAIDAGTGSCPGANGAPLPQDQRENPRPSGAACDMGAYER